MINYIELDDISSFYMGDMELYPYVRVCAVNMYTQCLFQFVKVDTMGWSQNMKNLYLLIYCTYILTTYIISLWNCLTMTYHQKYA